MTGPTERETVVVVHGTFAQTGGAGEQWHEPGSSFCAELDQCLREVGSGARCWAHLGESSLPAPFSWDGRNSWLSRARAAVSLRQYVGQLIQDGWTCHIVAHSHGGNIVLRALHYYGGGPSPVFTGKIALLGTPILEQGTFALSRRSLRLQQLAVGLSAAALLAWGLHGSLEALLDWRVVAVAVVAAGLAFLAATAAYIWDVAHIANHPYEENAIGEQMLLINSDGDEAFQLLKSVIEERNPLLRDRRPFHERFDLRLTHRQLLYATRERRKTLFRGGAAKSRGFLRRQRLATLLIASFVIAMAASAASDGPPSTWVISVALCSAIGIWGMQLIYSLPVWAALIGPVEFAYGAVSYWTGMVSAFGRAVVDPLARGMVWRFMARSALGVGDSPFGFDTFRLARVPSGVDDARFRYSELPAAVRIEAERKRDQSFSTRFQALSRLAMRPDSSVETVLQGLAELDDLKLVHSSYYREPGCVRKIARWIGRPVEYHDRFPAAVGGMLNWRLVTGPSAARHISGR